MDMTKMDGNLSDAFLADNWQIVPQIHNNALDTCYHKVPWHSHRRSALIRSNKMKLESQIGEFKGATRKYPVFIRNLAAVTSGMGNVRRLACVTRIGKCH